MSQAPKKQRNLFDFWKSGGLIGIGNDYTPEAGYHVPLEEVAMYREIGMDNFTILKTLTINSAQILWKQTITGSLKPGKQADIVVSPGNILKDIFKVRNKTMVFKDGVLIINRLEK